MTDPIADLLTRIRNGYSAKLKTVTCPESKVKLAISKILEKEGYIGKVEEDKKKRMINITLKYDGKKALMENVKRVSKPGIRIYVKNNKIPKVYSGLGISVISTPNGIMTNKEARKQKIGGELLCQVW